MITTAACSVQNLIACIPDGAVLAPFVKVRIEASGVEITVGNESSFANNNTAVIKDFEFGHSNGFECRFKVYDEQGGSFSRFMEHLMKDFKCLSPDNDYSMKINFGWILNYCDGASQVITSPDYFLLLMGLNCSFSDGKFIYEVEAKDVLSVSFQAKHSKVYGGDAFINAVSIKEAIETMFQDPKYPPTVSSVRFLRPGKNKGGNCISVNRFNEPEEIEFKDKDFKGKFIGNNLSKVDLALKWLADFLSDQNKAFVPMYNAEVEGGEVIFWETIKPGSNELVDWAGYSAGAFVVNGGKQSNVLQFNPKFKWVFPSLQNASGHMGVDPDRGDKIKPELTSSDVVQDSEEGSEMFIPDNERIMERDKPGDRKLAAEARQKQMAAMQVFRLSDNMPIEAELVVLGDPLLSKPSLCMLRNIHIKFINPYYLFGGSSKPNGEVNCGEWYVQGPGGCNPILSNKAWLIQSIVHRISAGKFTTTFNVKLLAPGVDIDTGSPFGGDGSGGWVPPLSC